jgi:hypothetical protein
MVNGTLGNNLNEVAEKVTLKQSDPESERRHGKGAADELKRGFLMRLSWNRWLVCIVVLLFCLSAEGCMGWGDIFAPKHAVSGDYSIVQGESEDSEVYLMMREQSVSIAGPLHRLGWNEQYIIFTDAN